jgi:uncharacterized protein (DUF924 family)
MSTQAHSIFEFWFGAISDEGQIGDEKRARWFKKSPDFDSLCREHYEAALHSAAQGELEDLKKTPEGCVSFVLLCDQMPRNIFRDTPEAFAWDHLALQATMELIESGALLALHPTVQAFALMPLMHSENREVHELSIKMFDELKERGHDNSPYAISHKKIIDRFGRYPHRNAILGRESTEEEIEFLKGPSSSF